MGSKPRRPINNSVKKTKRRPSNSRKHLRNSSSSSCGTRSKNGGYGSSNSASVSVSDKLEALKNLIPCQTQTCGEIKTDQLFQQTADYIILLKTQVFILQSLIDSYGSSTHCDCEF